LADRNASLSVARWRPLGGPKQDYGRNRTDHIFLHEEKLVILNGFIKKTQKTPDAEIELAQKRKKEIET
jgi:phage-related protein